MPASDGPTPAKLNPAALWAAALALAVSVLLLALFSRFGLVDALGDTAFVAVLILPLAAYALIAFSDRVTEVSAGGVAVKFAEFANAEAESSPTSVDPEADVQAFEIVEKGSFQALSDRRRALAPRDKVAMTIQLGRQGYYTPGGLHHYLNTLLAQDAGMPVIFVDEAGRFQGSTLGVKLRDALSDGQSDFIERIEQGQAGLAALTDMVAVTTMSLAPGTTNSQALEAMLAEDVSVLVSVDDAARPVGVVRRDAIMARMLTTLAAADAG